MYIEGHKNKVADALSWYYKSLNDDNLLIGWAKEAMMLLLQRNNQMAVLTATNEVEPHQIEADSLDPLVNHIGRSNQLIADLLSMPTTLIQDYSLLLEMQKGYNENLTWCNMLKNISDFKGFSVTDGLLCQSTNSSSQLLVIPDMNHKGEGIRGLMIKNIHKIVGHYSCPKTLTYMHKYYWWPTMAKDVE